MAEQMMQGAADKTIPEGYKQTEVGVIPEDWLVEPLENFTSFISYGFTNPMPTTASGPYMITARDISNGKIQYDSARTTDWSAFHKLLTAKSKPQLDDVLLTKDGTLGRVALVENESICINQSVAILRPNKRIFPNFFKCLLDAPFYQAKMLEDAGGSTIKHIYITIVNKMVLGLPADLTEQAAIATGLSDTDALIAGLEQLIAKKQAIKTAAMQQLLTGHTRLPQFALRPDGTPKGYKSSELGQIPEDWEVDTIGKVCDLLTGYPFPSNKYSDSGIRLLRGSNVKRGVTDWNSDITQYWPALSQEIKQYELLVGDVVISMDGSLVGRSFAQLTEDDLPAVLLQRVARIRSVQVSQYFLKEWICSPFFTEHCDSLKTVTAIPHISPQDIRDFKLLLPPTLQEQTAIATILSDMDSELNALEQKLAKARDVKQGMMQQLLTGRIRLPLPKEA
ncbi:MAG: restriction endonuclease subunit S [Shewanella sp.]